MSNTITSIVNNFEINKLKNEFNNNKKLFEIVKTYIKKKKFYIIWWLCA